MSGSGFWPEHSSLNRYPQEEKGEGLPIADLWFVFCAYYEEEVMNPVSVCSFSVLRGAVVKREA